MPSSPSLLQSFLTASLSTLDRMLVLNPAWPHFVGIYALLFACFLGLFHHVFNGWTDRMHCKALLNDGSWLDSSYQHWQPDGCVLHKYTETEASLCLHSKDIIFVGDSVSRKLFFEFARSLDYNLPELTLKGNQKHADYEFQTKYGTNLRFAWDPFLNTTFTRRVLVGGDKAPPAMLVLGSGLWYLRYANTSGGIPAWESRMDSIFNLLIQKPNPADEVIILPVESIVTSKLSRERSSTMHPSDIEAMNSDLFHRINPPVDAAGSLKNPPSLPVPVSFPLVFNKMLDESMTEDGLHFSDVVLRIQARILLNLRCNDAMPKVYPFNKTCCNQYPSPSLPHIIALALVLLTGPFIALRVYNSGLNNIQSAILGHEARAPLIISISLLLIYFADRSDLWMKEQRQFDPWVFGTLSLIALAVGLATVSRSEKHLGFLNRDQTDEWKGWMQAAILIYHYCHGSQTTGIYNPIRVLVASYLFMTGYGHTSFCLRYADFRFNRILRVLLRLNLFTILLAYTMNTDYIFYYFTPLVTMWYIVVYLTLLPAAQLNNRTPFLLTKILLSAGIVTWFFGQSWLLETLFQWLNCLCGIHWNAREWAFRVNLDIWIVYVGMLVAVATMKIHENRLSDNPRWPILVKGMASLSVVVLIWFFAFELYQESKMSYNAWHPYISFLPILAFVIVRNSNAVLRSMSSRAFAFLGRCSLELFIVQFHFWLAADSKAMLVVLPGVNLRPINFIITSVMFVYLSDRISWATGNFVNRSCGGEKDKSLPRPVVAPKIEPPETFDNGTDEGFQDAIVPMKSLDLQADGVPFEPETPIRPQQRWVDRLADHPSLTSRLGPHFDMTWILRPLNSKLVLFLFILWLLNILWLYPLDAL